MANTVEDSASSNPSYDEQMFQQIKECQVTHDVDIDENVTYFDLAEPEMEEQWETHIYPNIKKLSWDICLDLAAGHGRNTEKLKHLSKEIHLVDVNESCIRTCQERFGEQYQDCKFHYHVNDGYTLSGITSESIDFIYSWDAMVHFDKLVIKNYVTEFFRIMKPGAYGFIHHSNYGTVNPSPEWMNNPGWRSNMTARLFVDYCQEAGLNILKQQIINDDLDCISIFQKPKFQVVQKLLRKWYALRQKW